MSKVSAIEQLDRYIRARYPLIAVLSHEEGRVMSSIRAVASRKQRRVVTWTITQGLRQEVENGASPDSDLRFDPEETLDPIPALSKILAFDPDAEAAPVLFVIKDLHGLISGGHGSDPVMTRYLRDIALKLETNRHNVILLSPVFQVPGDLEKTVVVIDWPLPDTDELSSILSRCEADLPSRIPVHLNGNRERVIQAMRGLTAFEAGSVLLSAVAATGELAESSVPFIVAEKAQIIKKAGVLEYYDTDVTMSQVGGLPFVKSYSEIKRCAFSREAQAAGVDAPKGVLLVGVPGTGKSLAAKAIAGGQMPLLRMDIGALMGGLVGQSEANMRSALKVAEAVSPCVLWVDEIEKALGGMGSGDLDGGTSSRVFGTLLTWMQETPAPVYVVATANDVRSLKPELLRRFDDIFWVDLPNYEDRKQIVAVHLEKRKQSSASFDIDSIATATWGFSGAEIEKVVKSAVEAAFFQKQQMTNNHLLAAAASIVPIGVTSAEKIADLRNWAQNRALPASSPLEDRPVIKTSKKVELDM